MIRSRIVDASLRLRASYWFVPALLAVLSIFMAGALIRVDLAVGDAWVSDITWLGVNEAEGARSILATVAGSMITVAGVTFSLMLLAVSHATAQIGPHLLGAFMRDRGNQVTLGTFISTFLYCMMLLRSVHGSEGADAAPFIPHIAVNGALVLAGLSVTVLIYFIHHVPQSINVTNVTARVGDDLVKSIESLYPREIGEGEPDERSAGQAAPLERAKTLCLEEEGGYVRVVDDETLMESARENGLVIELLKRPGEFALKGEPLMRVSPEHATDEALETKLRCSLSFGAERTPNQDVLLPVQQLLEIVGRALSPGVNNQYTAVLAIHQLGRGLREMLARRVPEAGRMDSDGVVRIIAEPVDHERFLDAVLGPLHQYVSGDWIASSHVVDVLERLASLPELGSSRAMLEEAAGKFELPEQPTLRRDTA